MERKTEQISYWMIIKIYGEEDRAQFIPDQYQNLWRRRPSRFYTRSLSKFMKRKTEHNLYQINIKSYGEEDRADFILDHYQRFWSKRLVVEC